MSEKKSFGSARWLDKFMGDYAFYSVEGQKNLIAVYVKDYYAVDATKQEQRQHKLVITVLSLLAICLYFDASVQQAAYNLTWYVGIFQIIILVLGAYLLISLYHYFTRSEWMKEYTYKVSSKYLISASGALCVCLIGCAIAALIATLTAGEGSIWPCARGMLCYGASAGCMYAVRLKEKNVVYLTRPSDEKAPKGAVEC